MEVIYSIDGEESQRHKTLVLKLATAEERGVRWSFEGSRDISSRGEVQKFATEKDREILKYLYQNTSLYFPFAQVDVDDAVEVLKLAAITGKLFFKERKLLCDFLGRAELLYSLHNVDGKTAEVEGRLKWGKQEVSLKDCDLFLEGEPPWFIKGIILKLMDDKIHKKWFEKVRKGGSYFLDLDSIGKFLDTFEDGDVPHAPKVLIPEGFKNKLISEGVVEALPCLHLQDKRGAYANLLMKYPDGRVIPMQDIRLDLSSCEVAWEEDLFETDFVKKQVGNSHYHCPMDKVSKSLSFLVELGWEVMDASGNQLVCQSDSELLMSLENDSVVVRGRVRYDTYDASVVDIVGAFNRKESFVSLGEGKVGLLPKDWSDKTMSCLVSEEIVGDEIKVKKSRVWGLADVIESHREISLDLPLEKLLGQMSNFEGISYCPPTEDFHGSLRLYQQEGLNWLSFLEEYGFHGILADDMGLGKTVQVLAFLSRMRHEGLILIVVPTTLIFNWKREIESFLPDCSVYIHKGSQRIKDQEHWQKHEILLTSYGTMRADEHLFEAASYRAVILDEAQAIKNPDTRIAKSVCKLQSPFRLSITGTPIENNLTDLWSQFRFLLPDLLGSKMEFNADILASQVDSRHLSKIRQKVRPFILRRRKSEVAKDLPEKTEQTVYVEMREGQRAVYDSFVGNLKGGLLKKVQADGVGKHRMEVFEAILRLRQICCHPLLVDGLLDELAVRESAKMESMMADLDILIAEGHKVLVYSQFTSMLNLISKEVEEHGWKYVRLDGQTRNRERVVQQFQEDKEVSIFLLSLKAGGVGLNLTSADYVFLFEPWWNDAAENQAIDRAHRIGRKNPVIAKRFVTVESIEEKIMLLKASKKGLIDDVIEQEDSITSLTVEDFSLLLS
ncbi:MAG: superfamily II DNA or RNA helicase [Chlamydiales bacterium]|jgi:superfamily II DNA or RNA helicase